MGNPVLWIGTTAITAVRNIIQDPAGATTTRWTSLEIASYLDRAMQQIVSETETAIETSWTASLVNGTREYALPANFFKDKVVEFVKETTDVRRLVYLNREEYEELYARDPTMSGEPQFYWYWAKKGTDPTTYQTGSIYVHPVPGAAEDTKTLRIWGYKIPDSISGESPTFGKTIELEPSYVEAMLMFAAGLAKLDDGDHAAYDRMMGQYRNMVTKIMDTRAQKSRGRISQIRGRASVLNPWGTVLPWRRPWVG